MNRTISALLLALLMPALLASPAFAQDQPAADSKQEQIAAERKAAYAAADKVLKAGPAEIKLIEQGTLSLPAGYQFVPQPEAGAILRANGSQNSTELVGLVYPAGDAQWVAILRHINAGYVKDEEAKDWNADDLLKSLKEGTESNNEDRAARGFPALEVKGWIEKPAYYAENHRLIWSALVLAKGEEEKDGSVNYNTYALGRDGYFSLNLITTQAAIGADKANARTLLAALSYLPGKGYGDFNASTDHIAEYGLAALIGGVAAKKLGLLALGAAFFLKFAKIIGIAVIAFGAGIAKLFGGRKKPQA